MARIMISQTQLRRAQIARARTWFVPLRRIRSYVESIPDLSPLLARRSTLPMGKRGRLIGSGHLNALPHVFADGGPQSAWQMKQVDRTFSSSHDHHARQPTFHIDFFAHQTQLLSHNVSGLQLLNGTGARYCITGTMRRLFLSRLNA